MRAISLIPFVLLTFVTLGQDSDAIRKILSGTQVDKLQQLVLLPVSSFSPNLDLFAHIFVASQSQSYGYAPSSRLDLNKNLLRLN